MREPPSREPVSVAARRTNWTTISLIGALVLLIGIVIYLVTSGNPGQDKLTTRNVSSSARPAPRDKLCASSATYDLIKRELFRRAAELRGSDQAAFDKLSAYAVVRMGNPVMESQDSSTNAVNCSGSLSVDLPPSVALVGGRRTLSSDVDYTVTSAADGSGPVVLLRNADAIITPLATMGRTEQPATQQLPVPTQPAVEAPATPPVAPQVPEPARSAPLPPAPAAAARKPAPVPERNVSAQASFDCGRARTRGEIAVCSDSSLAALDRQMAAEYRRAYAVSPPGQRELLLQTAHRFYTYRDRCSTNGCIGAAYAGRMREIRDIVQGLWQPPR